MARVYKTRVGDDGEIVLPRELREQADLSPGAHVVLRFDSDLLIVYRDHKATDEDIAEIVSSNDQTISSLQKQIDEMEKDHPRRELLLSLLEARKSLKPEQMICSPAEMTLEKGIRRGVFDFDED